MQSILEQITDWLKSMIISGIMGNLSGMFDSVNQQVGQIAGDVGTTPANFSPAVFSMIRNISESVILPIAGMVLTFIACYELIQMLIEHNNLANFETWTFFKWVFKTFLAVTLISNTFNITMAVFDVAQQVISRSGGLISGSTSVSDASLTAMQATLEGMDLGPLLGLYLQTFVVQVTMLALSAIIFVIVYGRMVEIYLMVSGRIAATSSLSLLSCSRTLGFSFVFSFRLVNSSKAEVSASASFALKNTVYLGGITFWSFVMA